VQKPIHSNKDERIDILRWKRLRKIGKFKKVFEKIRLNKFGESFKPFANNLTSLKYLKKNVEIVLKLYLLLF